ncbi:MAG: hypothetical protein GY719_12720 [bacterium]|nr:hypothetical protein [bacterium]
MKRRSRTSKPPEPTFFVDRDLAGKQFLAILRDASIRVEDHNEHFGPTTPDEEWLAFAGERGWVALSRDKRIRRRSAQTRALMEARVRAFMLVGNATHPELARNIVRTIHRIKRFLRRHREPFIAKISRPNDRDRQLGRPGNVKMWLSYEDWLGR